MEHHIKALLGAVATGIAWAIAWTWATVTSVTVLSIVDFYLRIALSVAGLVVAYYTARYYKRNSPPEKKP